MMIGMFDERISDAGKGCSLPPHRSRQHTVENRLLLIYKVSLLPLSRCGRGRLSDLVDQLVMRIAA